VVSYDVTMLWCVTIGVDGNKSGKIRGDGRGNKWGGEIISEAKPEYEGTRVRSMCAHGRQLKKSRESQVLVRMAGRVVE